MTFEISAFDEESVEIQYSWIFNQGLEDETQLYGKLIQYDFDIPGVQRVICIAQNDVGLSSEAEIIVTVLEVKTEENSLNQSEESQTSDADISMSEDSFETLNENEESKETKVEGSPSLAEYNQKKIYETG